jgi:hypothetical protein
MIGYIEPKKKILNLKLNNNTILALKTPESFLIRLSSQAYRGLE